MIEQKLQSEPLDANKTDLTHNVTALAAAYLASRGFKPIESEVSVGSGWIADLASFVYPSPTELKNLRLYGGRKIIEDSSPDEDWFFRRYGLPLTAIVEVKTTRQDFQKDIKRKFDGRIFPAHLCYLAYPKGIIEELPEGWIGLEIDEKGERLLRVKISHWLRIHPQNPGEITDLIGNVAIRLYHRFKYAQFRMWSKMYRAGKAGL